MTSNALASSQVLLFVLLAPLSEAANANGIDGLRPALRLGTFSTPDAAKSSLVEDADALSLQGKSIQVPKLTIARETIEIALFSVAASIDNLVVSLFLGVGGNYLTCKANMLISCVGAASIALTSWTGLALGSRLDIFASLFAGIVFLLMGLTELHDNFCQRGDKGEKGSGLSLIKAATQARGICMLAVILSINNFAGGFAAGLANIHPCFLALATFFSTFGMMSLGNFIGREMGSKIEEYLNAQMLAGLFFVGLSMWHLLDFAVSLFQDPVLQGVWARLSGRSITSFRSSTAAQFSAFSATPAS